ncbi:RNA-binding protein 12B [Spea bombifrons]|uniref:RNA-binding protein 12B n=1 Tax=Spea bombifrons TaxID=233779 RepID=UPI00234B3A13|nr:RNA-binding protein 12B [Spea bombifrons]
MAVVIRLQGLPVIAGSADIRHFFSGLSIPDGGVHIIGGKSGEAFIIFATDEDARRAMSRAGGVIKKSYIQLFLSSKTEMQNTLDMNRKGTRDSKHSGPVGDLSTVSTTAKKGMNQNKLDNHSDSGFHSSGIKHADKLHKPNEAKRDNREPKEDDSIYVFLYGLPYSATPDDIRSFFDGLHLVDIIFLLRPNGVRNGNAFVKFGSVGDANAALKHNNEYMGHRFISVKKTSEEKWVEAGGQIDDLDMQRHPVGDGYGRARNRSRSPRRQRTRSQSPHLQQFYIHLTNLSFSVAKHDIKNFLSDPDMADTQIKFLLDEYKNRTREGFVMLDNKRQYEKCLGLHRRELKGRLVYVFPITRKEMLQLIDSHEQPSPSIRSNSRDSNFSKGSLKEHANLKRCLYLRNFPFDVSKGEVQKFFVGFAVREDDVILLYDSKGVGLGEAVVRFPSEEQAILAEGLNRQRFLGTEVLLRRISEEQTKQFGSFPDAPEVRDARNSPVYEDDFREPVNSRDRTDHPLDVSEDFGNRLYEPVQHSVGLSDFGQGHNFRGSPERQSPYHMNVHRGSEPFGKFDIEERKMIDYSDSEVDQNQSFGNGSSGALIRMRNLPFTATTEEVLDFFYGYNVIPESINFKRTKNGLSTGTATVCIKDYNEAVAAVNELNERPIGSRKVILSLLKIFSFSVAKHDIKNFLSDPDMADTQIKFLLDEYKNRTREGFVMLDNKRQYEKCLGLHRRELKGRLVYVFPITRKEMLQLIDSHEQPSPSIRSNSRDSNFSKGSLKEHANLKRCLYLRNFPFDVSKGEVQKFFVGFAVREDDVILLYDSKGVGLGEAVVRFPSEEQAILAEGLNRQRFLGTEVLLRRISEEQTKQFGSFPDAPEVRDARNSPVYEDDFREPVNSRDRTDHPLDVSEDFGNRLYEPVQHSVGLSDFGQGHNFRGSPERQSPYHMNVHRGSEPFGKFDIEERKMIDYSDSEVDQNQSFGNGSSGALIRMRNLPFTATTEEVLDFFYGYNVIPESINFKRTKNGLSTGTATVCIKDYNEAVAAVNELNERPIGSRKVILSLLKI